jgi:hypothetical protein
MQTRCFSFPAARQLLDDTIYTQVQQTDEIHKIISNIQIVELEIGRSAQSWRLFSELPIATGALDR